MPIIPVPDTGKAAERIRSIDPDAALNETIDEWRERLAAAPIRIPESKVQNYLLANTAFNLLAIDRIDGDLFINVNTFQYHRLYPGNGANMCVALDYMGHPDMADACLRTFHKVQFPDGSIRNLHAPENQSFEITGYALWAWGRHAQLSGDLDFLQRVYPGVQAAVRWFEDMRASDAEGLLPPATVTDDAMLANVRQTGMSLWVLIALRAALRMADMLGRHDDAARFRALAVSYREAFEAHLAPQLERSGGIIPPAMERTVRGNRWDDLLLLYPEVLFDPDDERVAATIDAARGEMSEGILTFGWLHAVGRETGEAWPPATHAGLSTERAEGYIFDDSNMLHYWQTPNNAQNDLVRGTPEAQEAAVRDLYALLLHTSATHAPQEFGTYPWSTRDYLSPHNILPDGAASAKTIELVRNMLVREFRDELVLFSALSPAWVVPGKRLELVDQPTSFGPVSLALDSTSDGDDWCWRLTLENRFRRNPRLVRIRLPWFTTLVEITGDPAEKTARGDSLELPPASAELSLILRPQNPLPDLNFDQAVNEYKTEYRRLYNVFLRTGDAGFPV